MSAPDSVPSGDADPAASPEDTELAALRLLVQHQAADLEMVAKAIDDMETAFRALPAATVAAATTTPPLTATAEPGAEDPGSASPTPFDFAALYTWVHIHVATITELKVSKGSSESGTAVRWCTRWYDHDDAVARLEALRRAWEEHVVQPGAAMSSWYIHHFDPHIGVLTAAGGPFWQCSPGHHQPARVIGHELIEGYPTTDPEDTEHPPTLIVAMAVSTKAEMAVARGPCRTAASGSP